MDSLLLVFSRLALRRLGAAPAAAVLVLLALTIGGEVRPASADTTQRVWLHYDYMVAADGRSDAPAPSAIQMVVDVFAAHGIDLQIDPKHAAIPEHKTMLFDYAPDPSGGCSGGVYDDTVSFKALKAAYFHPTANHEWHYAIFGYYASPCLNTGISELPGDNLVIGLGIARDEGLEITPMLQASVFMHELGHNLGLRHGGGDDHNDKPNYLSIMNYSFLFHGIPYASQLGSTQIAGFRLDYSEQALPTLDEAHLDETTGLGAGTTDITEFETQTATNASGPANGPIDWNQDGDTGDKDVAVNLNITDDCSFYRSACDGSHYLDKLTGFNDWAEVHAYLAGTLSPGPKTFPHESVGAEPIVLSVSPPVGSPAGGTLVTIKGAHFRKTTNVNFGGRPALSFTVDSDNTLTAVAPPGLGTVDIGVVAGDNPSPSVSADRFLYLDPPTLASISPGSGPATGGTMVTLHGANLTYVTAVSFGDVPAASFNIVDGSTVTAVSPPTSGTGTVDVTVTTPAGTSPAQTFGYVPVVMGISPSSGPTTGGTTVTITGSGFTSATSVALAGNPTSFTIMNDHTITFVTQSWAAGPGSHDVSVTNPAGTSATSPADLFSYV